MRFYRLMLMASLMCCLWGVRVVGQEAIRFVNHTEVGIFSGGERLFHRSTVTFQTFNGFRLNEFAELGATVGLDSYSDITLLPVAVGWRGILPGKGVSPYLGLDVGYGLTWLKKDTDTEKRDGGLMFNPAFGIRIRSKGKERYSLSLGYRRQVYSTSERLLMIGATATGVAESGSTLPPGVFSILESAHVFQRMSIRFGMVF